MKPNTIPNLKVSGLLFPLLFFLSFSLSAKTIIFKDGSILRGEILDQDQMVLKVKTREGKLETISKDRILKVHYQEYLTPEEEAAIRRKEMRLLQEKEREERLREKAKTPPGREQFEKKEEKIPVPKDPMAEKTAWGAFFRSLIIPGWGQFYQGRPVAGSVYAIMVVGGGVGLYEKNRIYKNSVRDFDRLKNPQREEEFLLQFLGLNQYPLLAESNTQNRSIHPSFYLDNPIEFFYQKDFSPKARQQETVKRHFREKEAISYGLAAIWIWNAIDAFIFHPTYEEEEVVGFQENLDRGNWKIGFDSRSVNTEWDIRPGMEHRLFLQINF